MSDELALVDTNILVYALYPEVEHHVASRSLLDRAQGGQIALCLSHRFSPSSTWLSQTQDVSPRPADRTKLLRPLRRFS